MMSDNFNVNLEEVLNSQKDKIKEIQVLETIIRGKTVYRKN